MGSTSFRILGPFEIDGNAALGGPKQRALLALLLLNANETLSRDRLVDALWPHEPPETARHALQVYVSQLRKALPSDAEIVTAGGGYRLAVAAESVDARRFEELAETGRTLLAEGDAAGAARAFAESLALWRGRIELEDDAAAARLESLRWATLEDHADARLALAQHEELVPELEALVVEEPLRERLRRQLMLALYRSGRQADALAVYRDARRTLSNELGLEPGGELRELEAAILRHDPALAVEPPELKARRRLPSPATPLVGRRREVEEVAALLRGDARLVTLTGPGGTGKTRIALQTAHELADRFPDGVVFVGLAALRDSSLVLAAIETVLEGEDTPLADRLRDRRLLLLVDNFEQVDEAAPELAALLADTPDLRLLVTSRHALRIYGEHEYDVPPLSEDDAFDLFTMRAKSVRRGFRSSAGVRELCERLDRLPLAIELAAGRARELSVAEMLETLPRLELAAQGPRDAPDRHRGLRSTITWSHDLLDPEEQLAFARVSVFAGGFTRETAAAVCDADARVLSSLAEKNLLTEDGQRLGMLETIREFAREQLDAAPDAEQIGGRHAEYFLELSRSSESFRRTEREIEWMDTLEAERENLRESLAWLLRHDAPAAASLAVGAYRFWYIRGHFGEGRRAYELVREHGEPLPSDVRAELLMFNSAFAFEQRDLADALDLAGQSLALHRERGDAASTARALVLAATIHSEAGDRERAVELVEEAVGLARGVTDTKLLAFTMSHLALATLQTRDLERARAAAVEAIPLMQANGDVDGERLARSILGEASFRLGDEREAIRQFAAALALARQIQNPIGLLETIEGIAAVAVRHGEGELAVRLLASTDAFAESREVAPESWQSLREQTLAQLRESLGDRLEALLAAAQPMSIAEAADAASAIANTFSTEGRITGDLR
jgi:predicted ATPase/DNA-binding SARP family transcriptional activator